MFFQTIYPMLAAGTDLSINIRRVNDRLSVAVMPRHAGVKDEAQQNLVPLILSGTAVELDAEFLQAIAAPVSRTTGLLTNLETFERQAAKASSESRAAKTAQEKESKEAREKREKMEKLLKKTDEAVAARRYSEALIWLKQARVLAPAEKQQEIDGRTREVQKLADAGSLFAVEPQSPPAAQPIRQPAPAPHPAPLNGRPQQVSAPQPQDGQMQMFPAATVRTTRTVCGTAARISAAGAGRAALLLSATHTGRTAAGTGTAGCRNGTRIPYTATGHA